MNVLTLGSLFDGIGGFPLAGSRYGIKALWASEIEPFPIKVTKIRLPDMKHLGDITKINGADIEPVDIITFGSPCQDLSVAGKRAGLAGERSGLFMEAVRIIKEMRNTYDGTNEPIRPRFAVWENVPGAFSSNKGEDFRAVLEELAKVADETVAIPEPPKGKWSTVGTIMGDGWSIAWRILDAQYWGVPQRRRRIFLVADFGGSTAPEILFKRKGLSGYFAESGEARERVTADAERSFRETGPGYWGEGIGCLRAEGENRPSRPSNVIVKTNYKQFKDMECEELLPYCPTTPGDGETKMLCEGSCCEIAYKNYVEEHFEAVAIDSNCQDSRFKLTGDISPTIPAKMGTGGNNGPMVATPTKVYGIGAYNSDGMKSSNPHSGIYEAETSRTLDLNGGSPACNQGGMAIVQGYDAYQHHNWRAAEQFGPMTTGVGRVRGDTPLVSTYSMQRSDEFKESEVSCTQARRQYKDSTDLVVTPYQDKVGALCSSDSKGMQVQMGTQDKYIVGQHYSVRRLTPLECERLQGYPDGWTDIEGASDSARYKALGNSVAIPCVEYVLEGISEILKRD